MICFCSGHPEAETPTLGKGNKGVTYNLLRHENIRSNLMSMSLKNVQMKYDGGRNKFHKRAKFPYKKIEMLRGLPDPTGAAALCITP